MRAWEDFIDKQQLRLGKQAVDKWLRTFTIVHFDSGNLYLEAKDPFHLLWFEEHIRPLLKKELLNNNFRPIKVHVTILNSPPEVGSKPRPKEKKQPPLVFAKDKLLAEATLDNYVPGFENQLIFRFFCELTGFDPSTEKYGPATITLASFNPIFLWGGSGTGKTHLLMALANSLSKKGLNVLYARAETFTEHVVFAIRNSEMQSFRQAYRHVDVLLIDDVHLFARKDATQEEFFHTFNALHTTGRQIILSSQSAPSLLNEIEPRLVSRFEWGINLHLKKLDLSALKQVLLKRCATLHFPLSDSAITFLTETFPSSKSLHRALEALILRSHLQTDARLKRDPESIDEEIVKKMLHDLIAQEEKEALSPEKIIATVAASYGIRSEDLLGKSQSQECSLPRQIAMYLCRQELKIPYQKIGQIFHRDHSTVMTSIRQIQKKIEESDTEILSSLAEIHSHIENEIANGYKKNSLKT